LAAATVARCAGAATGRQTDDQVMPFDTAGFALEDVAIVALACARLVEL
jgi:ornithine cyclodeaminase/alanine dehydrogenase-like protein (mu-crystallin family)